MKNETIWIIEWRSPRTSDIWNVTGGHPWTNEGRVKKKCEDCTTPHTEFRAVAYDRRKEELK